MPENRPHWLVNKEENNLIDNRKISFDESDKVIDEGSEYVRNEWIRRIAEADAERKRHEEEMEKLRAANKIGFNQWYDGSYKPACDLRDNVCDSIRESNLIDEAQKSKWISILMGLNRESDNNVLGGIIADIRQRPGAEIWEMKRLGMRLSWLQSRLVLARDEFKRVKNTKK